jgi:hypothetical protein
MYRLQKADRPRLSAFKGSWVAPAFDLEQCATWAYIDWREDMQEAYKSALETIEAHDCTVLLKKTANKLVEKCEQLLPDYGLIRICAPSF